MVSSTREPGGAAEQRFTELVLPEVEVMMHVALSITANKHDAEDLVQDTLVRAFRAIDSFDGRYPRAWVLTILRNTNINNHRKRRPELERDPDPGRERPDPRAPDSSAEAEVMAATFDATVQQAFLALPDDFRRVVTLVDIDQHSYAEAARIMGTPVGTVMSRLHRARKRIRDELHAAGVVTQEARR
ncbi:MAG: sigma-70 family RNA polymerase sigma factor [Acidimicrobiales bacterium]